MQNSDQEKQDPRTSSVMEDSTAMTIEFLRARLLSERSVSRSARQRADELARRVADLEEQIQFVYLQRKKAEKATADVLAILENNGISDISESYDSSSDQETPCESKVGNGSNKEEDNSVFSKLRRNEAEVLSGSEMDFSSQSKRSLSWRGRKCTRHNTEKYKDSYMRRRSSFRSVGSSPKYHEGKSCRQIRRRESKSAVEELKLDSVNVDSQENGVATSLKVFPDHSDGRPEILNGGSEDHQEEKFALEGSHSGCLENKEVVTSSDIDFNEHGGDNMEKALEHQAQLIGRYKEMEKAQREWEERFRENNNSTPDSCDPGNQSDVTEEREEIRAQQSPAGQFNSVEEAKSEDVCFSNKSSKTQPNGFLLPSHGDMQGLGNQKCGSTPASESLAQDSAFSMANGKRDQESLVNSHSQPSNVSDSQKHHPHPHGSPGNQSAHVLSNRDSTSSKEVPMGQNEMYTLVPCEKSSGEVLEALKQARLSLQQQVSRLPLTESESVGKAIELSVPAMRVCNGLEIPGGCAGLFRLPTDFAVEESRANLLASSSQPSLANYYPSTSLGLTGGGQLITNSYMDNRPTFSTDHFLAAGDQLITRPYMDRRSSYSTDDRLFTSQYSDSASRISGRKPPFDGNFGAGIPPSRQYNYPAFSSYPDRTPRIPTQEGLSILRPSRSVGMAPNWDAGLPSSSPYVYPALSSYPDLMPRTPSNEGLFSFPSSRSVGMPPATHTSFSNDHTRPNMYR